MALRINRIIKIFFLFSLSILFAYGNKQETDLSSIPLKKTIPDITNIDTSKVNLVQIDQNLLQVITPGKNGVPLPVIRNALKPKIIPFRLKNRSVIPAQKITLSKKPEILTWEDGSVQKPDVIQVPDSGFVIHAGDTIWAAECKKVIQPKPVKALPFTTKDAMTYDIKYMDVDQKLPASYIYSVYEDRSGNLWLATYLGISRFDGASVYTFTQKEGLLINYSTTIIEDTKGNLWFGTISGLCKYNGSDFIEFTEKQGLVHNKIWALTEDQQGNIWIGTAGGISKFDGKSFTNYTEDSGLANNEIWAFHFDNKNKLWIGTDKGLCCFNGNSFINYTNIEGFDIGCVNGIEITSDGNIWLATDLGLRCFDGKSFTVYTQEQGLCNNVASAILQDRRGCLWVGTAGGGISEVHLDKLTTARNEAFVTYSESEGLSMNKIFSLFEDKSGNIWAGTSGGGLNCIKPSSFVSITQAEGLPGLQALAIHVNKNDDLWIGMNENGACRFDGNNFFSYSIQNGLLSNGVTALAEDNGGNIWFGTDIGVSRFDGKTFTNYTTKQGLAGTYIYSIYVDKNNNIWFFTRGGISKFDGESFINFDESTGYGSDRATCGIEDSSGNFWFGTDKGLTKYDGSSFVIYTTASGLSDNYINSIMEAQNGELWLGTDGGLSVFNGENFTNYNKNDCICNNLIWSTLEDSNGNVWVSTENGLSYIILNKDVDNGKNSGRNVRINSYTKKDGLKAISFKSKAACIDKKNRIWWCNNTGLVMLNLNTHNVSNLAPQTQFNSIEINETFIDFNLLKDTLNNSTSREISKYRKLQFSGVSKFKNFPEDLILPYQYNTITFHYSAIDWNSPHKIQYTYQLEGADKNWNKLTTEPKATYRNLPFGEYTFKVKALGMAGKWSNTTTYQFRIMPPWWQTYWMYIVYFLILIGMFWQIGRWRMARMRKQKEILQRIVKERTSKVMQQKEKLMAQAEILKEQNEQLLELDEFKQSMTSMIVHDLKNPLNAIINPSSTYKLEKQLNSAKQLGKQMMNLVQNILDVHKYEKTQMKIASSGYSLFEISQKAINEIVFLAERKSISLQNKIKPDTEILGDNEIIERIFINLLSNAIKYTQNNGKVILYSKVPEKTPDFIKIMVSDTGEGIPSDKIQHIFSKFGQVAAKKSGNVRSTGLGLTFCKMAVEAHGGQIGVESELSKGTTMWFTLQLIHDKKNSGKTKTILAQSNVVALNLKEKQILTPFAIQLNETEIYKMFELRKILRQIDDGENEGIKTWKEEITNAIQSGNQDKYSELLKKII